MCKKYGMGVVQLVLGDGDGDGEEQGMTIGCGRG